MVGLKGILGAADMTAEEVKSQNRTALRPLMVGCAALLVGVLLAGLVIWGVVRGAKKWPGGVLSSWLRRTTQTDMTQPTVVDRIQKLQRLETVVFTMEKIVTGGKQSDVFPDFLAGDRLLMLVHGEAIAGIDFATLKTGDVRVEGKQVRLHLPQAQVLVTRLDSEKTRIYSRQTGWLVPTDPNLESQVRVEAEKQLLQSALADGILQKAQENARSTITSLMQGMGFAEVRFE